MTTFRGTVHVIPERAIQLFSGMLGSIWQILGEFVENAIDADAKRVWLVLAKDTVQIIDNGHGMVPEMLEDERKLLEMFLQDIQRGVSPGYEDVRILLSNASLNSLEWLGRNVGFSGKARRPRDPNNIIKGERGIGFQGFRQIANEATCISRANEGLAALFWSEPPKPIPEFSLKLPTNEQVRKHDLGFEIRETGRELTDPSGRALESGTKVVITRLKPELESLLRPSYLAEQFRIRFSEHVRARGVRIVIVDRITEEGQRSGGKEIIVEPVQYRGPCILQEERSLPGGKSGFHIQLYYNRGGKGERVMFRWMNTDVRPLTDLSEFQRDPWTSGKLSGFVEFPGTAEVMSTDKTTPLEGPTRNQWRKSVQALEPQIREIASALEDVERQKRSTNVAAQVSEVIPDAIQQVEALRDAAIGLPRRRRRHVDPHPTHPAISDIVSAVVFDEHNRGIGLVTVELWKGSDLLERKETGTSGAVSFGRRATGKYRLRAIAPEGMDLLVPHQYQFEIEGQEGYRAVFHVVTGKPRPETPRLPRVQLNPTSLDDPGMPYRDRLHVGIIDINMEFEDTREAERRADDRTLATLFAHFAALAVAEHCAQATDTAYALRQAGILFGKIYARLEANRRK